MLPRLRNILSLGAAHPRVRSFDESNLTTLLSWTKTMRELRLWAGGTFPRMPDESTFREHLQRKTVRSYQAEDRWGGFIGYAELVGKSGGALTLCRVIIDPTRRGLGSGKAFVELLSRTAFGQLGFKRLLLNVFTFNTPALRCYRSLGFHPLPDRPKPRNYEGEVWELLVMKKDAPAKAA
ncbi:MAG: GNAT family protein [Opitutales bacterium]